MPTKTNASVASVIVLLALSLTGAVCVPTVIGGAPKVDSLNVPNGFTVTVFAEDVNGARSMCMSDRGTLFVGTRSKDKVYALVDRNNDFQADTMYVIAEGLNIPNGVAFLDGDLYVAEVHRVIRFDGIEQRLDDPPTPVVVRDDFPTDKHHGWKYIAFGPDRKLYVPVGAPCNICLSEDSIFASIARMNKDGSDLEIVAHGVRNSVGFDWDPQSGDLWFTDNGRDMMGDDMPGDELNHVIIAGKHFGYPFCHQGDAPDPEFGEQRACEEFIPPARVLGPHVAALGMKFYRGNSFPEEYHNAIFIAEHGSWNRSKPIGYRLMVSRPDGNGGMTYETFIDGWLRGSSAWGRPVALLELEDGSLLLSDDSADMIYRIAYVGQ